MNLDRIGHRNKSRLRDFQPVNAKWKTLQVQTAFVAGRQRIVVLIRLAHDVNGCLYAEALRVGDSKAQLAAIALRKQWESDQHKNKRESLRNTHGRFEML